MIVATIQLPAGRRLISIQDLLESGQKILINEDEAFELLEKLTHALAPPKEHDPNAHLGGLSDEHSN